MFSRMVSPAPQERRRLQLDLDRRNRPYRSPDFAEGLIPVAEDGLALDPRHGSGHLQVEHRHRRAIAQYEPGHLALLARIDEDLDNHPGLFLTGSSYRGISVNACAKEAEEVADRVLAHLAGLEEPTTEAIQ